MHDDKMLERIRALLAKAEDRAASPEESEAYTSKAMELMARYAIDDAMLTAAGEVSDEIGSLTTYFADPYSIDKGILLNAVARAFGCKTVRFRMGKGSPDRYVTVGYERDLSRIDMLVTSLLVQIAYGMTARSPRKGESTTAYRKSWMSGFIFEVATRLRALYSQATETSPGTGTDIVLRNRADDVDAAFSDMFGNVRESAGRNLRGSGWGEGADAGRKADIGQKSPGGGKRVIDA